MGDLKHWLLTIYFIGFAIFSVITWIDNAGKHYACCEPPSGLWAGFNWPLWAAVLAVFFLCVGISRGVRAFSNIWPKP